MAPDTPDWIRDVIKSWDTGKVSLNPGASQAQLDALEWELGFKFPYDFKQFYTTLNGFQDFEMEGNMFSVWSISRILQECEDAGNTGFIGFCDFLINSHIIGFQKESEGVFKKYWSPDMFEFVKVTGSFQETIMLIHQNSELIY